MDDTLVIADIGLVILILVLAGSFVIAVIDVNCSWSDITEKVKSKFRYMYYTLLVIYAMLAFTSIIGLIHVLFKMLKENHQ